MRVKRRTGQKAKHMKTNLCREFSKNERKVLTITPNHGNISKLSRTTAAQPGGLKKNQKSA